MKSAAIIKRLTEEGWVRVGGKGDHAKFKHPAKPGHVVLPHPRKDIANRHTAQYLPPSWLAMEMTMHYLAYIHKDPDSAWSATFPDFPGCFTAADGIEDLPRMAQEAVEVHFDGEDLPIPQPTAPEDWADDARFTGGYWVFVDIDLSKISTRAVRLNISLPESLLGRIDAEAKARHLSRSAFLALAAQREMAA
jgi:predicted RNase H-like HicB family nuclease/predicted RNA binding protein YcfA (HicA-like mRNA interferase family)